jgi:hypothetical protein
LTKIKFQSSYLLVARRPLSNLGSAFLILLVLFTKPARSQQIDAITVRKQAVDVYFFPKDKHGDTISAGALFYLIIPEKLKNAIAILTDNARIVSTENDSLFKCQYLPGLKYESFFALEDSVLEAAKAPSHLQQRSSKVNSQTHTARDYKMGGLINGTSVMDRSLLRFRIYDKTEEKVILQRTYYFKP